MGWAEWLAAWDRECQRYRCAYGSMDASGSVLGGIVAAQRRLLEQIPAPSGQWSA